MARLYAATGDGIVWLDGMGGAWTVELLLSGSGALCLAVDSAEPDTVYAGLREGGVRQSVTAAEPVRSRTARAGVVSLAVVAVDGAVCAGSEPGRLFRAEDRGEAMSDRVFEAVRPNGGAGRRNACSLSRTRTGSP